MPAKTLTKTEEPWIGSFTPWDDKNPPPSFAREPELTLPPAEEELPTPEAVAAVPQTGPGGGRSYCGFLYEQLTALSGGVTFTITTPQNGDTLIYNSSSQVFENLAPALTPFLPLVGGTITGNLTIACPAANNPLVTTASLTVTTPAHTAVGTGVTVVDVSISPGGTLNLATGARAFLSGVTVGGRTYSAVAASVIDEAAGVFLNCLPVAGTNVTLSNRYALYVNGPSRFESGASGGITYVWRLPTDDTPVGASVGRIPILINGALKYIPYHAA